MGQTADVYDLGELEEQTAWPRRESSAGGRSGTADSSPRGAIAAGARTSIGPGRALAGTLSLLLPGAGQVVRGDLTTGVFFLTAFGFLGTLGWALLGTTDRWVLTLDVLGYPRELGVCALAALFILAGMLHLASVMNAGGSLPERGQAPHPATAGVASAIVPGWGQLLNGDLGRATLFLGAAWAVTGVWVVGSAPAGSLLRSLDLALPDALANLCAPGARWTLTAVLWALAVYDAAASAANRR